MGCYGQKRRKLIIPKCYKLLHRFPFLIRFIPLQVDKESIDITPSNKMYNDLMTRTKKNDVLNSLKLMSNTCQTSWQRI